MAAAILEQAWCSPSGGIYDVFTSFRYEDIGKTFADHLHSALHHSEFRIFGDKHGIERGENIDFEVENAIKESRMSIIIFSKGYASSSQCLDELAMILQHKKTSSNHHHILPIFYDVNPSDVSKQTGSFKEAFQSYEEGERKKEWKSKVDGWKTALREAADLAGMDVKSEANG
ncbi:17-beta-estradiol 17-dehydrogenase [Bertholletia excelsa]